MGRLRTFGLSLAVSARGRGDSKDTSAVAAAPPQCVCAHTFVCMHGCAWVPALVHRGGTWPLQQGYQAAHPPGLSLQQNVGSLPAVPVPYGSSFMAPSWS